MIPPGPGAARVVSQRRSRTRVALVAVSLALLLAVPLIGYRLLLSGPPDGSEIGATPSATPGEVEPTGVGTAALLRDSDVPPDFTYGGEYLLGDPGFLGAAAYCADEILPSDLVPPSATTTAGAYFVRGEQFIAEVVGRYPAADADSYFASVRAVVDFCGWSIPAEGFAGDESLIVTYDSESQPRGFVFVRVGTLIAEVWYEDTSDAEAVTLGQTVAQRLCDGTIAC